MRTNKYLMQISFGAMYGRNLGSSSYSLSVSSLSPLPVTSSSGQSLSQQERSIANTEYSSEPWKVALQACQRGRKYL
jgi:hypothetical protein